MSLDKFTTENVDDLIFDAIDAVRGRFHKRPDKNSICKYLNVSTETEKLYIENWIDVLLISNKIRNKEFQCNDSYFINYSKNGIPMNSQKQVKQSITPINMILKVVWKIVTKLN